MTPNDPHGRIANRPSELHAKGWRDVASRVWDRFFDARIYLFAAGAAFFVLLAIVPALATLVAIYGLAFDAANVTAQVSSLSDFLPFEARALLQDQLTRLTAEPAPKLGVAAILAFVVALWSASSATKAVIDGLNVVNEETEKRSVLRYNALALLLTISGAGVTVALLTVTVALPIILPLASETVIWAASYALLSMTLWLGLAALYRWAPSREDAKWSWLAPGSFLALLCILGFSVVFSWFARTFSTYSAYGSLGVAVGFMTWCWICLVILLLGALINAEAEHQTTQDSTTGLSKPLGSRGAIMADTVAGSSTHHERRSLGVKPITRLQYFALVAVALAVVVLAARHN